MRTGLISLAVMAAAAGCTTVRPVDGAVTPLGKGLEMRLPVTPSYPVPFSATQTVVGQYGERRAAFQAILDFSPAVAQVVLTAASGPRILSVTWTRDGIVEDRTPLAPADLKGLNVLGDIFVSLWPVEVVQAALPPGVEIVEDGPLRSVKTADRIIVEVETLAMDGATMKQRLRNLDFGYELTILTERSE
jgi:hypothetical protein